jgi:hypothetical protein
VRLLAYEFCRDVREAFDGGGCSQVLVSPSTSSAFFILACSGLQTRLSAKIDRTKSSAVRIILMLFFEPPIHTIQPIAGDRGLAEFDQRAIDCRKRVSPV